MCLFTTINDIFISEINNGFLLINGKFDGCFLTNFDHTKIISQEMVEDAGFEYSCNAQTFSQAGIDFFKVKQMYTSTSHYLCESK